MSFGIDDSRLTVCAFCDLFMAFDCVEFSVLLIKLDELALLTSYRTNSYQKIVIDEKSENSGSNNRPTAQGSWPRGQLFFNTCDSRMI